MVTINGNQYRLCLVDTNAVSEMVKNPNNEFTNFQKWAFSEKPFFIPSFSLFTIIELRQKPEVYRKYLEIFSIIPCEILKSEDQLFHEELAFYPDPIKINPILIPSVGLVRPDLRLDRILEIVFSKKENQETERAWLAGRTSTINSITSLVASYPPERRTFSVSEIHKFIQLAGVDQLKIRAKKFTMMKIKAKSEIDISAFPSLKMTLYTVFYKFYVDKRKYSTTDVFDIIISAPTPYVDAIVTERHQAEVIKKIKRHDNFLNKLIVMILKDIRA